MSPRASLIDPAQACILVIDIQERLLPAMPAEVQARVLKASQTAAVLAEQLAIPALITEQYPKGLGPTVAPLREAFGVEATPKTSFSAAGEPAFIEALEALGAERKVALLLGLEAHICVLQTGLDLLDLGYEVHLAADGVGSRTELCWRSGLKMLEAAGVRISNSETFAFQCLGEAGSPAFKAISKAIR